jgi:uncharacterized membrane protein (DUF485 family)
LQSAHEMLRSKEFRGLVRRKWTVAALLSACLFALYYGYILLIAVDKDFLARKVGEHTTLGILLGAAVIVLSWVLTAVYVLWANGWYDRTVGELKSRVKE